MKDIIIFSWCLLMVMIVIGFIGYDQGLEDGMDAQKNGIALAAYCSEPESIEMLCRKYYEMLHNSHASGLMIDPYAGQN